MANIQQYLENIRTAVYGEQVRGSIHDAIDIINKTSEKVISIGTDVTSANSSTEGYYDESLYLNKETWHLWKCTGSAWVDQGCIKPVGFKEIDQTAETVTRTDPIKDIDVNGIRYAVIGTDDSRLGNIDVFPFAPTKIGLGNTNITSSTNTNIIDGKTYGKFDFYIVKSTWHIWMLTKNVNEWVWQDQGTLKGDTGNTGAKGDKGDKGDTGNTGAKGDTGDPGNKIGIGTGVTAPNTSLTVGGVTYILNDIYINNSTWFVWKCDGTGWVNMGSIKGKDGTGSGDMSKSVYDKDDNHVIDMDALPFDGIATDTDINNIINNRGGGS